MAPRFRKKDESVEAGFRRIALAEFDAAIAIIDDRDRSDADKVHKVRRQLKALRALIRLVRPVFERFDKEERHFRAMARALSHTRDAQVMLDMFDAVVAAAGPKAHSHGFVALRERLCAALEPDADTGRLLGQTRNRLLKARGRIAKWTLSGDGWGALSAGMSRAYGHARDAMREAVKTHDAEASHEWRKGVKYHATHARLLGRMRPRPLGKREKAAARLGDVLGERHDIDLLLDALAHAPARYGDVVTVTQLAGLARLRSARLDRRARRLGESLFKDKPGKLATQWGDWWEAWRR